MQTLIFDKNHKGILIPLNSLLPFIANVMPEVSSVTWGVKKAYGYGIEICALDDKLREGKSVQLSWDQIITIANTPDTIIYDLIVSNVVLDIEFGVFDSTYLVVRGGVPDLHAPIRQSFQDVRQSSKQS